MVAHASPPIGTPRPNPFSVQRHELLPGDAWFRLAGFPAWPAPLREDARPTWPFRWTQQPFLVSLFGLGGFLLAIGPVATAPVELASLRHARWCPTHFDWPRVG